METIVKVVMVLTLAAAAAAIKKVDPKTFKCAAGSPLTNDPEYSNTNPPVALTHIFCGQIKNGEAEGFHSRALVNKNNDPVCARLIGDWYCPGNLELRPEHCKCSFSSPGAEVLSNINANPPRYTAKISYGGGPYNFFPDSWDAEKIVEVALKAFKELKPGKTSYCLKGVKIDDCPSVNVKIFTDETRTIIVSAFPVDKKDCK